MSITQTYRDQLKVIAQGIDTSINNLLNMATTDQLTGVIENHKHIVWNPNYKYTDDDMKLNGLVKDSNNNWWLYFTGNVDYDIPRYRLHDLNIEDVLSFMQTCENVLNSVTNEEAV